MKHFLQTFSLIYFLYLKCVCYFEHAIYNIVNIKGNTLGKNTTYRALRLEIKVAKRRRKRKEWERKKNLENNSKKKPKRNRIRGNKNVNQSRNLKKIEVPVDFSFITNRDTVLKFIRDIKILGKGKYTDIEFDFYDVNNISNGAITTLLSVAGWLNDQGITVIGNYPYRKNVRAALERSGFLDYFYGKKRPNNSNNVILCRGLEHTEPQKTAKEIRKAMGTVTGLEQKNTKLQGMLIELMANTVNHAYNRKQKGWYFSVDHLIEEKKVKFCFVDNGEGILETIRVKFADKFYNVVGKYDDGDILIKAFNGEYGSRTKLSYRGRGLPVICNNFNRKSIKSLKVISNNVFFDFEKGETELLTYPFDGTFYFWELDETCIQ